MPAPMALPVRVLFKGPSTLIWTSMMSGPRSDLALPRATEAGLLARGRAVAINDGARNGWLTRDLFKTWEADVAAWTPDVIVMAPAHMETVHGILPPWLERGANAVSRRPGRLRKLYYRRFLRGLARLTLLVQKKIDRPGRFTGRVERALRETDEFLKFTQQVANPLILLLQLHMPTQKKIDWFPGWPVRRDVLNEGLSKLAEKYDNVEFFTIVELMDQFDPNTPEDLWRDGIHFSPAFHQAIGEKLAEHVDSWASTQPHLAQP